MPSPARPAPRPAAPPRRTPRPARAGRCMDDWTRLRNCMVMKLDEGQEIRALPATHPLWRIRSRKEASAFWREQYAHLGAGGAGGGGGGGGGAPGGISGGADPDRGTLASPAWGGPRGKRGGGRGRSSTPSSAGAACNRKNVPANMLTGEGASHAARALAFARGPYRGRNRYVTMLARSPPRLQRCTRAEGAARTPSIARSRRSPAPQRLRGYPAQCEERSSPVQRNRPPPMAGGGAAHCACRGMHPHGPLRRKPAAPRGAATFQGPLFCQVQQVFGGSKGVHPGGRVVGRDAV
jgi:hypothetical protein